MRELARCVVLMFRCNLGCGLIQQLWFSGNALEEDLNMAELNLTELHFKNENDNDTNSVCSSLSTGFPASGSKFVFSSCSLG